MDRKEESKKGLNNKYKRRAQGINDYQATDRNKKDMNKQTINNVE